MLRLLTLAILCAALILSACSTSRDRKEDLTYVERPVEILYNEALEKLERKRYVEAVQYFDEVERQHPYTEWARRAILMSAFASYRMQRYDDVIQSASRFLRLHPGNKSAPYAHYLISISHYERILDVGRDQTSAEQAQKSLQDVINRYPGSEYARDAQLKIDLINDHLAGKELEVGRYYLRKGQYVASINRFKNVVDNYQTTGQVPEALHRMVEAYLLLGLMEEAKATAAVLGYNYPGSEWYEDSYGLLVGHDVTMAGNAQEAKKKKRFILF